MGGMWRFEAFCPALKFVTVDREVPRKPPQAICATVVRNNSIHRNYGIVKNIFLILITLSVACCGLTNKMNSLTPQQFCDRISPTDIKNFRQFDYNERTGWTKRNFIDSSYTQWFYDQSNDLIYINFGFNAFNETFNLPFVIADTNTVLIKQIDNDSSSKLLIQIGDNEDKYDNQFDTLTIDSNNINPLDYLKSIDKKRNNLGIFDIQNSIINNTMRFYISEHDILYYLPDSIENKYIIPIDSARIDTMSQKSVRFAKDGAVMINENWYYKNDKKGLDY
jgi:hypothetical protein